MKIKSVHTIYGSYGERQSLEIFVDENSSFYMGTPEPEDATLDRDLNGCFSIPSLMNLAYEAGKKGEEFSTESVTVNE